MKDETLSLIRKLCDGQPLTEDEYAALIGGYSPESAALLAGEESIREVIAFPKTAQAVCPLTDSPNVVDQQQLVDLGIGLLDEK